MVALTGIERVSVQSGSVELVLSRTKYAQLVSPAGVNGCYGPLTWSPGGLPRRFCGPEEPGKRLPGMDILRREICDERSAAPRPRLRSTSRISGRSGDRMAEFKEPRPPARFQRGSRYRETARQTPSARGHLSENTERRPRSWRPFRF